jgi:hypothetical protein
VIRGVVFARSGHMRAMGFGTVAVMEEDGLWWGRVQAGGEGEVLRGEAGIIVASVGDGEALAGLLRVVQYAPSSLAGVLGRVPSELVRSCSAAEAVFVMRELGRIAGGGSCTLLFWAPRGPLSFLTS